MSEKRRRQHPRVYARTIAPRVAVERISDAELARLEAQRPRRRADCIEGPRPCPWFGCRHHLGADVTDSGSLKLPFGSPEAVIDTCSLDVADQGPHTHEEIGAVLGVSRQRAKQIEQVAIASLAEAMR